MIVVTGKSGVGKTAILKKLNYKNIFYADEFVKDVLYKKGHPIFKQITKMYPSVEYEGKIDTKRLGKLILNDKDKLKNISELVKPFVKKWLNSLPEDSIVEMAVYINYEKEYKDFFNKVVLITRSVNDLSKFEYLSNIKQPIENKEIHYDFIINNEDINESVKSFNEVLDNSK